MKSVSLECSDACRQFAKNLRVMTGRGLQRLLWPIFRELERNKFNELLKSGHDEGAVQWQLSQVETLSQIGSKELPYSSNDILGHLLDPNRDEHPGLVEVIRGDVHQLNASNLNRMQRAIGEYIAGARKLVYCQRTLPMQHATSGVVESQLLLQQETQGLSAELLAKRAKAAEDRSISFLSGIDARSSETTIGWLRSGYKDLKECTGPYRYVDPSDSHDCLATLAETAVHEFGFNFRLIPEPQLDTGLREWIEPYDRVVAIDDKIIMKLHRGGVRRSFLKRRSGSSTDVFFDEELSRLQRTLKTIDHDSDRATIIRILREGCEDIERTQQEILAVKRKTHSDGEFVRPAFRVHVPES